MNKTIKGILNAVKIMIDESIKNLGYNKYIEGKIVSKNVDGTYNVRINGSDEKLPSRDGLTLATNDVVLISVVNGNDSFKFIDLKRPY